MTSQAVTPRKVTLTLALLLYIVTVSVDAVRKVGGLPTSLVGVVYLIVGCMYLVLLPGIRNRGGGVPRYLPLWLALLIVWCSTEALVRRIPVSTALLGFASYVFFVPLFYIGAELMASDRGAARTLRCVTLIGGVLGLGAILSAMLGPLAPAILQPINPSAGIHTFSAGNIYLAPSVFATGEEAAEELLIALFAWAALTSLPQRRLGRASSVVFATLITVGLFAAERRADIVVAILGIITLLILGHPARRDGTGTFVLTATPRARSATIVRPGSRGDRLSRPDLLPGHQQAGPLPDLRVQRSERARFDVLARSLLRADWTGNRHLNTRPRGTRRPDLHHFRGQPSL